RPWRRLELLDQFSDHVYGRTPSNLPRRKAAVLSIERNALGGLATRKLVRIPLTRKDSGPYLDLLEYLPNGATGPVPVFLGYNFDGNHTVTADPAVPLPRGWVPNRPKSGITDNRPQETSRGGAASAWPIETILGRGYGFATLYYGDVEADFDGGWKDGLRGAVARGGTNHVFRPGEWGAIGAWAWGLSRAVDYLRTDAGVDGRRIAVIGHSRLGKTALWAGAQDERIALVIANESGEGGAALARRWFGETVQRINTSFPHWFCGNFRNYNTNVASLPVDQHELIALCAPRPVYVGSAEDDRWADPRGEFLSLVGAEPVYALYGMKGVGLTDMPPLNTSVGDTLGYHIRTGPHALTVVDWNHYLDFADRHLKAPNPPQPSK
ncbi:MAG: acetylxylan esterase, partial [Verrucomicrobia bacterium]|nr:acetylxylan esterase [Verrucomicrobiota bacterium]